VAKTRASASAKPGMSNRAQIGLAVATALIGVIATKAADRMLAKERTPRVSRFVLSIPDSLPLGRSRPNPSRVAISQDGSMIAYVMERAGTSSLMLRRLADPNAIPVSGTAGALSPFFSPDGLWLAFVTPDGQLKKVLVSGGSALPIAAGGLTGGGSWGAKGTILFSRTEGIYRVSSDGGSATLVAKNPAPRVFLGAPQLLPGDEYALVCVRGNVTELELMVLRIADGTLSSLGVTTAFMPRYDGAGHLLFVRPDGILYAAPFSARKRVLTGTPVAVVSEIQLPGRGIRADYGVANDGSLVVVTGSEPTRQLVSVDRTGATKMLSTEERAFGWPKVSPDGRRVALEIGEGGSPPKFDVWVHELSSGTFSRVTTGSTGYRTVGWSNDGKRILYMSSDSVHQGPNGGMSSLLSRAWDGSGSADTLHHVNDFTLFEGTVGPPHTWIAFRQITRRGPGATGATGDIGVMRLDSVGSARPFVSSDATEVTPRLSPDGRYIAYASDETGALEIYVRSIDGSGQRLTVSTGGGTTPVWAPSGRELFYLSPTHMVSATITLGSQLAVAGRKELFEIGFYRDGSPQFDIFPDGNRFIFIRESPSSVAQLSVIINWQALLKKQ
jgi:Tol biopolymer transport system component